MSPEGTGKEKYKAEQTRLTHLGSALSWICCGDDCDSSLRKFML